MMTIPEMFPIELTVDAEIRWRGHPNYIRHIFYTLCDHKEVLKDPDYKRLHDEALDYLFRYAVVCGDAKINERTNTYLALKFLAELYNENTSKENEKFPMQIVDRLLEKRRKIWMM